MSVKYKKVTVIYAIGQILNKLISFLLVPLYTYKLGTEGFGQLSLVDMIYSLVGIFVILGIGSGYIRYYNEYDKEREKLKNTAITFALIVMVAIFIINLFLAPFYSHTLLKIDNAYYIMLLIILRASVEQFSYLLLINYSMTFQATKVVKFELIKLVLNLLFVIYYVAFRDQEILGMYKGYVISNFIVLIILLKQYYKKIRFEIDKKMLRKMFKYSVQLLPSGVAAVILNLADRYVLEYFVGLSITGVYSLGYKFGILIDPVFVTPFKKAFTPFKYEVWNKDDANEKLNIWYEKYHILGISIILLIAIFSKSMVMLFSSNDFIDAYKIVPLILISYFIYGKSEFFSLGIYVKNKVYYDPYIMISGGILNIVLNILLIPKLNMYGATLATILSYMFINICFKYLSNKVCEFKFKTTLKIMKCYFISIFIYIIYYFLTINNMLFWKEIALEIIMFILWVIGILILKIIDKDIVYVYCRKYLKKLNNRGVQNEG
ncbi:oligosaccharide flippase family protein [Clostridium carnis]